jgi:hypothetical protein
LFKGSGGDLVTPFRPLTLAKKEGPPLQAALHRAEFVIFVCESCGFWVTPEIYFDVPTTRPGIRRGRAFSCF